jgi:branched-chain amino acid transport system permease protein
MRGVADSALLAALSKVDVHLVSALAWAISAVAAAVAGIAVALRVGAVDPVSIGQLGLLIFPVVIIGGVDSIRGAMVGGMIVAVTQNIAVFYLGGNWVNPVAYAILLAMLLVRPRGLFGTRAVARI